MSPLTPGDDLDAQKALAEDMGLTRGELLTRVNFVLVVEGEHDRLVLQTLFGKQLDKAGVTVLRMHGTSNLTATAEMDFVARFMHVPVGVLLDHVRLDRVQGDEAESRCARRKKLRRFLANCDTAWRLSRSRSSTPTWWPISTRMRCPRRQGFLAGTWSSNSSGLGEAREFKPWLLRKYKIDLILRSTRYLAIYANRTS